jgi:DNA repair exonuclease SbcCD ATPase subunit
MAMLFGYGAVLLTILVSYNRAIAHREARLLEVAVSARDASAARTQEIENELFEVRERLGKVEPTDLGQSKEIAALQSERQGLRKKLEELAEREGKLRQSAARTIELEQEGQALEDLLEEASEDLSSKEEEIQGLQTRLKNAPTTKEPTTGGRARGVERLIRRMRTLYKSVEFDDRAIQDIVALRDETMKLKAEEVIKRLDDESEQASIRRKVGGLPPQLSIFEMGFAGKGRIYYMRGKTQRYRVLLIGAKNSQKSDLDYLSRL